MLGLARLHDLTTRRPLLMAVVGGGLLAEGARVLWGWHGGGEVVVLGHGGLDRWSAAADGPELLAYAGWVGVAGLFIVISALLSRMATRGAVPTPSTTHAPAAPVADPRLRADPPVVVRTRTVVERVRR